jgi:rare lipoprotein A
MKVGTSVAAALLFASASLALSGGALAETATWYGGKFCHRKTASGEMMDCNAFTAAHHSYRPGMHMTWRVSNPANNKSVVVRINDHKPGGGIDLSPAAGREIGMIEAGRVPVSVSRASGPVPSAREAYAFYPKQKHRRHKKAQR